MTPSIKATTRADGLSVFISSSATDAKLVEELRRLLLETVPGVKIRSSMEREGGIAAGSDWQAWVRNSVRESSYAVIVITPASIKRPWLTWEAGIVSATDSVKIVPIAFELEIAEIPPPFSQFRIARGDRREDIVAFLSGLLREFDSDSAIQVASRLPLVIEEYVARIQSVLDERRRAVASNAPPERAQQAEPARALDEEDVRMLCELLFRLVVRLRERPEMLQSVEATTFWAAVRKVRPGASTLDDLRTINADLASLGAPGPLWDSWMRNVHATELALLLRHGDITIQFP